MTITANPLSQADLVVIKDDVVDPVTVGDDDTSDFILDSWVLVEEGSIRVTKIIPDIDIKPGSFPNSINAKSNGLVPVAILGSATFDVTQVDVTTLEFGPGGATPAHDLTDLDTYFEHLQDVNDDGFLDLVSHYRQKEVGLQSGDTTATLSGNLLPEFGGIDICGTDSVRLLHS